MQTERNLGNETKVITGTGGECVHSFLDPKLGHILTVNMPLFIKSGSYNTPYYVNHLCSNNDPHSCTLKGQRAILQPQLTGLVEKYENLVFISKGLSNIQTIRKKNCWGNVWALRTQR